MTLEQCTKEELIFAVNWLAGRHLENKEYHIKRCLNAIQHRRTEKLLLEADNWNRRATEKRQEYIDIVSKIKNGDHSLKFLTDAKNALDEAEYADKQILSR